LVRSAKPSEASEAQEKKIEFENLNKKFYNVYMPRAKKESVKENTYVYNKDEKCCDNKCKRKGGGGACGGAIYGLGLIGAAVYFIQHATDFWMGVLGLIKAIFWPALFVWKALELLKF
jgi:hypothetical protein